MKKLTYFIITVFIIITSVSGCVQTANDGNATKKRYLMTNNHSFVYDIEKADQEKILELLDIKIPENEDGAYLYSFGYKKFTTNDSVSSFVVEIDGVKDYSAFFESNKDRVSENGLDGLSSNEYFGMDYTKEEDKLGLSYYITYSEDLYDYDGEESEISKELKEIFDRIKNS